MSWIENPVWGTTTQGDVLVTSIHRGVSVGMNLTAAHGLNPGELNRLASSSSLVKEAAKQRGIKPLDFLLSLTRNNP